MNPPARWRRPSLLHGVWVVVVLAILLVERGVGAEPDATPGSNGARSVVVLPPSCNSDSFPLVAFVDALRVELTGMDLRCCILGNADSASRASSLVLDIELVPCAVSADRVRIVARPPDAGQAVEREISLADVAEEARPRALALAVAEVVRWTARGLQEEAPQLSTVPTEPPPSPSSVPTSTSTSAFAVHIEAEGRGMPTRDTMLWGGRLRLTGRHQVLHGTLDFGTDYSRIRNELGELSIRSVSAGAGFGPSLETRAGIVDFGVRAELGWGWVRGQTTVPGVQARAGSDLISSLGLRVSFETPTGLNIRPGFSLECGGVVRGLDADVDGQPVAGFSGYYVLGAVGMVVSP